MGWMRIRAGSNVPRTVTVTYNLTGLVTNGASTASAYTSFSFILVGGGNRVPPDTIRIWVGGVFQAQGIGYTYNKDTGAVTIRNVVGDIVVEAIGKIATVIWTPDSQYTNFIVLDSYAMIVNTTSHTATKTKEGYWIIWSKGNLSYDLGIDQIDIVSGIVVYNYHGYYISLQDIYYAVFDTPSAALTALYKEETSYTYASSIDIRYSTNYGGRVPDFYSANYGNQNTYVAPYNVDIRRTPGLWYEGSISSFTNVSVLSKPEYDVIRQQ